MKTIKSILIAATLISASMVSALSAQEAEPAQKHEFKVAIGDSVMIKRECQKYLTGETPSTWVWDKVHTVRQLGTKRNPNQFPDGVLLMNIYSWMCEDCLINVNGKAKESAEQAAEEQKEEREAFEQAIAEQQAAEDAAAAAARAKAAKEEEERLLAEQQAAEEAAAAAAAAQAAEEAAAEQAKQDSIKSEQKFKHNYDRFTIGLRGGAASLLHSVIDGVDGKWKCGFDVMLDLQYAHYWSNDKRPVDLGIIVGLGVGYARSGLASTVDDTPNPIPADGGGNINYHIQGNVKENDGQIQLEVPVLFSLIHDNGLFFNVGPKVMLPVYTLYDQKVADPRVDAYFTQEGVLVQNAAVTGLVDENSSGKDNGNQFKINLMLTAELGYEWTLKSGNSLGLGAYADYSVFNTFKNDGINTSLLDIVSGPTATDNAVVNTLSATNTYANKLGYFDVGVKVAYHFNFPKKQYKSYKANKL